MKCFCLLLLFVIIPAAADAEPYIPGNAEMVLEVLPQPEGYAAIRALQKQHQQDPIDRSTVYGLIDAYIKLGKQEADPRYYGYAEAMIKPLLAAQKDAPDIELWVAEANILQHRHDFDAAFVLLNKVLRRAPDHPNAHLMRAVIEIARGEYAAAKADCRYVLSPANGALLGLTCVSMVDGLSGKLSQAYQTLQMFHQRFAANASNDELGWTLTTLGELAQRLGDAKAAEQYFRDALAINTKDYYAMAALADLLLAQKRPDEVASLLAPYTLQDNLLLRLALAEQQRHGFKRDPYVAMMQSRIRASNERHETVHLRDYARFALELEGDKQAAFKMAKENWKTQKEPADARILIESATAVGDKETVRDVMAWEHEQGYQDATFASYGYGA